MGPKTKRGNGEPVPLEIRSVGNGYSAASFSGAVGGGEQGVVAADADILAGIHLGAALADDDVARQDLLAAEALHAQALAVRIAAVA